MSQCQLENQGHRPVELVTCDVCTHDFFYLGATSCGGCGSFGACGKVRCPKCGSQCLTDDQRRKAGTGIFTWVARRLNRLTSAGA